MAAEGLAPSRRGAPPSVAGPAVLSLLAAFGWAAYYPLVLLAVKSAQDSAILLIPPLVGGGAYVLGYALAGGGRALAREARSLAAYLRAGLMAASLVSLLAATFLIGPVDASLLSLLGDVVATPAIAAIWFLDRRAQITSPKFVVGLLLSLAGGSLAIVGGRAPEAIPPAGWSVVVAVPLSVALYFVLSAKGLPSSPPDAVAGFSIAGAALVLLAFAPLVRGSWAGLVSPGPPALAFLVLAGIASFAVAPAWYFRAIARIGLAVPPMLMTAIPVFTLLLARVFLGYEVPWLGLLGIPLAVAGGFVALRSEAGRPSGAG